MDFSTPHDSAPLEAVQRAITEHVHRVDDAVDAMCERMLVLPGEWGVLVTDYPDGTTEVQLSHDAPPMTVGYLRAGC